MSSLISVQWRPRRIPLEPVAVAAHGLAAQRLAERLLTGEAEALAHLRGGAGDEVLLVLGAANNLPWVDGAVYLGQDPIAPGLYLPTAQEPDVPLPLLETALRRTLKSSAPVPFVVLPAWNLLLPLTGVRPLAADWLRKWLNRGVALHE